MKRVIRSSIRLLTPTLLLSSSHINAPHAFSSQRCYTSHKTSETNNDNNNKNKENEKNNVASETQPLSAVDVENFTLRPEIVQRDLDNLHKWNELSRLIEAARSAKEYTKLLHEVSKGLSLLEELGPLNAPIQCETLLCMEAAQAWYNLQNYTNALDFVQRAEKSLTDVHINNNNNSINNSRLNAASQEDSKKSTEKVRSTSVTGTIDHAQLAEIRQFKGFTLCKLHKAQEAYELFTALLQEIEVISKEDAPMQAVAAINLRRSLLTGQAESLLLLAQREEKEMENMSKARELYAKALDLYIDALNTHIDENDSAMVKMCLTGITNCFEALQDIPQACTTCKKYISWCERHKDTEGVKEGQQMWNVLRKRHNLPTDDVDAAGETK